MVVWWVVALEKQVRREVRNCLFLEREIVVCARRRRYGWHLHIFWIDSREA